MALSSKQKKLIGIGSLIWKIVSSMALIFLFVITTTSNFSSASTTVELMLNEHSKVISELKPKVEQLDKVSEVQTTMLQLIQKNNEEEKESIEQINSSFSFVRESLSSIQTTLKNQAINIEKFWAVDWKNLNSRLDRIEIKLDGNK